MNFNRTGIFIPVSEIFPNVCNDFDAFKSLLSEISLTDALFWCARLNLIVTNPLENNHIKRQQTAIDLFLTDAEINAINKFALANGDATKITVFFRGQLLELLRWILLYCHNHPNDGKTFEEPNTRKKFVQAALIASDFWSQRVYGDRFSLNGEIDTARERALGAIRKAIEDTELCPELTRSFGRGWTIFMDYFRKQYNSLDSEFRSSVGLSIEDYFKCLLIITVHFANPKSNNTGIFNPRTFADSTCLKDIFQKYIAYESQTVDELRDSLWGTTGKTEEIELPYNYLPLREKPILCSKDNRAIILDPIFYNEKASIGPLFILTKNKTNSQANEIFGAFGKAFEDYASDILNRMFPDIDGNKQLFCNLKKEGLNRKELEMDACIIKHRDLILIETKAVWIREDKILNEDSQRYLEHLREKYGVIEQCNTGTRKVKGVGQLARIANNIVCDQFQIKNPEFNQVATIYPILLVYDAFLDAPVYGQFLASEFESLFQPDQKKDSGELIKNKLTVHPLVVLTIEDLENLEFSINHFELQDLLSDYSINCPDRLASLNNYIAGSKYAKQMYYNKNLAGKCLELFEQTKAAIKSDF